MNNKNNMELGLSYDDVLLKPKKSSVKSRKNVDTRVDLSDDISLEKPFISANMDTVTEEEMAKAMAKNGGMGIMHRFQDIENQVEKINQIEDYLVGGSVGVNEDYIKNTGLLIEAGADAICIDIAHGHLEMCLNAVEEIKQEYPDITLIAGNIATKDGAIHLSQRGVDVIKVGIGPGSTCITREVTGVGVPQFTAIRNIYNELNEIVNTPTIIADGGIKKSGDIVKSLMAGADAIMAGSLFSGCKEAPGEVHDIGGEKFKIVRGMASSEAREENHKNYDDPSAIEGKEGYVKYSGEVKNVIDELIKGVRSGLSYCGGHTIEEARENAEFIRITNSTKQRNGTHGIQPNFD